MPSRMQSPTTSFRAESRVMFNNAGRSKGSPPLAYESLQKHLCRRRQRSMRVQRDGRDWTQCTLHMHLVPSYAVELSGWLSLRRKRVDRHRDTHLVAELSAP